jgi:protein arginine kinase
MKSAIWNKSWGDNFMGIDDIITKNISGWMVGNAPCSDIVISSRIRLARNIEGFPFPVALTENKAQEVLDSVRNAVSKIATESEEYSFIKMTEVSPLERFVLVEKHLISPQHAEDPIGRGIAINQDQVMSIMVNEEDHLRIQCILPGLNFDEAWNKASATDDAIENSLDIAFGEKIGYLTACPTNVGTGLRASAMLHLPALVMTNQVNKVLGVLPQLGLAVRGMYGEGSEAYGNLFQISNQVTLGKTEDDILANLSAVTKQIVEKEKEARKALLCQATEQLEDRIWRAIGILRNARLITGQEALALLSDVRLGVDLGILNHNPPELFNELLVVTSPAHLQYFTGHEMLPIERDKVRADTIRSRLG